jgi:hypothetical protein
MGDVKSTSETYGLEGFGWDCMRDVFPIFKTTFDERMTVLK